MIEFLVSTPTQQVGPATPAGPARAAVTRCPPASRW